MKNRTIQHYFTWVSFSFPNFHPDKGRNRQIPSEGLAKSPRWNIALPFTGARKDRKNPKSIRCSFFFMEQVAGGTITKDNYRMAVVSAHLPNREYFQNMVPMFLPVKYPKASAGSMSIGLHSNTKCPRSPITCEWLLKHWTLLSLIRKTK